MLRLLGVTPSDRRPLFARAFPHTPALDSLVHAFGRGDYALVRAEGRKLAESASEEDVRCAARTLVDRTAPDPLAAWLLVLAGGLLVVVSAYWIVQGKPAPTAVPETPHVQSTR
jgi:hypothetical protein